MVLFADVFSEEITGTGMKCFKIRIACFQRLGSLFSRCDIDTEDAAESLRAGLNYLSLNVSSTQHLCSSSGLFETSAVEISFSDLEIGKCVVLSSVALMSNLNLFRPITL